MARLKLLSFASFSLQLKENEEIKKF